MAEYKVLLVEDDARHIKPSAFPPEVSLTCVGTFNEAVKELLGVKAQGGYPDVTNPNPQGYRALLTDMNFPIGEGIISEVAGVYKLELGKVQPLGWPIIYLAVQAGIPLIGMLTDTNHHDGPMAATMDVLERGAMRLEDSVVAVWDSRTFVRPAEGGDFALMAVDDSGTKQYQDLLAFLEHPERYAGGWVHPPRVRSE